jgi:hypothetical protein
MRAHLVHGVVVVVVVVVRELPIEIQSTPPFMCYVCTFDACTKSRIMYSIKSLGRYKERLYSTVCSWEDYLYNRHTYIYLYV